jgi:hypothetical protein
LATTTLHFAVLAAVRATASLGLRSRASAPFARLGLNELGDDRKGLGLSKSLNGRTLGIYAKAGALLSLRRNPQICDDPLHVQRAYHRMAFGRSAIASDVLAVFTGSHTRIHVAMRQFHERPRRLHQCGF